MLYPATGEPAYQELTRVNNRHKSILILSLVAGVLLVVCLCASEPPSIWKQISTGMTRNEVYHLLGNPTVNVEPTKGIVLWQRDWLMGRWELDVSFRSDETVAIYGTRWRWNW